MARRSLVIALTAIWLGGSIGATPLPARDKVVRGPDAVDRLLESVQVDDPVSYKGMTLFTVSLRRRYSTFEPLPFDKALGSGDLTVRELKEGDVNRVRVINRANRAVFIMSGEVLSGSKQDRILQQDVLIPARSGWIEIPVYCVEAGRWKIRTPAFESKGIVADPGLRSRAYSGQPQSVIWEGVDSISRELGVHQSKARALQEVYDDSDVQRRLADYMRGLPIPRHGDVVGFVAFSGHRILGADLFGNPELFAALRDKLLRSYLLSTDRSEYGAGRSPDGHQAAGFLARAWSDRCSRTPVPSPGSGASYRLDNREQGTGGGAIVYDDDAVHISLFPQGSEPVPVPMPRPLPVPR